MYKRFVYENIDLITEYRASLISDVVTGKVDVRGIVVDDVLDEAHTYKGANGLEIELPFQY